MTYRVVFDDVCLQLGESGIARVWTEIIYRLQQSDKLKSLDIEPYFINRSNKIDLSSFVSIDFPNYDFRFPAADRKLVSRYCESVDAHLFVSSYYTFALETPNLGIVYDLIPERFGFGRMNRGWFERELSIKAADSYFVISENTKKDLNFFYPYSKRSEITVAYPGIDTHRFKPSSMDAIEEFKSRYSVKRYFVMLGSRYGEGHYKNGELVINAVQMLEDVDFGLIFIGGEELTERELRLADEKGIEILRLNLGDQELIDCLSGAEALIYPSLYEGFGMPPVESLAVGTPVITTRLASLPEAAGELAMYISGYAAEELASILSNPIPVAVVQRVREEGPRWASKFSWEAMTDALIGAISNAVRPTAPRIDQVTKAYISAYSSVVEKMQH